MTTIKNWLLKIPVWIGATILTFLVWIFFAIFFMLLTIFPFMVCAITIFIVFFAIGHIFFSGFITDLQIEEDDDRKSQ